MNSEYWIYNNYIDKINQDQNKWSKSLVLKAMLHGET